MKNPINLQSLTEEELELIDNFCEKYSLDSSTIELYYDLIQNNDADDKSLSFYVLCPESNVLGPESKVYNGQEQIIESIDGEKDFSENSEVYHQFYGFFLKINDNIHVDLVKLDDCFQCIFVNKEPVYYEETLDKVLCVIEREILQ